MSFPVPLPSTFMPLPLAIMIPFMGIQSGVMAQQFGMNFQFGKRKISAMSNEEFNKLTPAQLQVNMNEQIKLLIPTFGEALREMRPFQRMIFEEMLAVMKTAIDVGIDVAKAGVDPIAHIFGQHIHGSTQDTQSASKFQPPPAGFTSGGSKIVHRHTPEHHIGVTADQKQVSFRQYKLAGPRVIIIFTGKLNFTELKNMERALSLGIAKGNTEVRFRSKLNQKWIQQALVRYFGRED